MILWAIPLLNTLSHGSPHFQTRSWKKQIEKSPIILPCYTHTPINTYVNPNLKLLKYHTLQWKVCTSFKEIYKCKERVRQNKEEKANPLFCWLKHFSNCLSGVFCGFFFWGGVFRLLLFCYCVVFICLVFFCLVNQENLQRFQLKNKIYLLSSVGYFHLPLTPSNTFTFSFRFFFFNRFHNRSKMSVICFLRRYWKLSLHLFCLEESRYAQRHSREAMVN